jgi:hypothetical protein
MSSIEFTSNGIVLNNISLDMRSPFAVPRLVDLLGPELHRLPVGVSGSGRTGHWLASGVLLLSQSEADTLVSLIVIFDPNGDPFRDVVGKAPIFGGEIVINGQEVRGGESEAVVWSLPGVEGIGTRPFLRDGDLFVGFDLKRPGAKRLRRPRVLVSLAAEWGA